MRETPIGLLRIECHSKKVNPLLPYHRHSDVTRTGTGFLCKVAEGEVYILTAHHVVQNAEKVTCSSFSLSEVHTLTLIGCNPYLDIAVLTGPKDVMDLIPYSAASSSSSLSPQDELFCIGFANATLRSHTTSGTVSGRSDYPHNRIQTDAVINPGNSGGPVLDKNTKTVIGVVTSGMTKMQATNFFAPMDEVRKSLKRMMTKRMMTKKRTWNVDQGYHLNAVVRAIDSAACGGNNAQGGALVVGVSQGCHELKVGDVILSVSTEPNKDDTMVDLDEFMRVKADKVWSHDAVDFRTLLDAFDTTAPVVGWSMVLRREDKVQKVTVSVQRNQLRSRKMFPDCEKVHYLSYGGLIVQNMSSSHKALSDAETHIFRNPVLEAKSFPVITHVMAGSPFSVHGQADLIGSRVVSLQEKKKITKVDSLEDMVKVFSKGMPLVLELDTKYKVGCKREDLLSFERNISDPFLKEGLHKVRYGPEKMHKCVSFSPSFFTRRMSSSPLHKVQHSPEKMHKRVSFSPSLFTQ